MELQGQIYDASMPLELFRANEVINAVKRQYAAKEIMKHYLIKKLKMIKVDPEEMRKKLRTIFLDLLEQKTLLIYENSFSFEELDPVDDETLIDYVKRAITTYLALGKIDIASNLTVTFTGDKRVLKDIKILAENGYGEDLFGNNIVLPSELSYLRR
jgi:KaiC/GvpD/RAD55 family RecA-like ATPase